MEELWVLRDDDGFFHRLGQSLILLLLVLVLVGRPSSSKTSEQDQAYPRLSAGTRRSLREPHTGARFARMFFKTVLRETHRTTLRQAQG